MKIKIKHKKTTCTGIETEKSWNKDDQQYHTCKTGLQYTIQGTSYFLLLLCNLQCFNRLKWICDTKK